jgi:hypothetical protein
MIELSEKYFSVLSLNAASHIVVNEILRKIHTGNNLSIKYQNTSVRDKY